MTDYKVTKEIKLTDSKREEFFDQDKKIVVIKMKVAALSAQIQEFEDNLKQQLEEMKQATADYHKLIETTAKELEMDMDKKWSFNTVELKYVLEESEKAKPNE